MSKQQDIPQSDNELIAAFMGYLLERPNGLQFKYWRKHYEDKTYHILCGEGGLRYDTSWDWLMPVVEKISRIVIDMGYDETAYPRTFGMLDESKRPMVRLNKQPLWVADTLIQATYIAVVEFIKWYNQQTPKP